ncbi:MAG: Dethiobiotin synthetase [Cyanobacteria bacterium P01_D01_bin.128]
MDFATAVRFVLSQALGLDTQPDYFIYRLSQGQPPVPGQVTSLLLALKVLYEELRSADTLERSLACALFVLAYDSRAHYRAGAEAGVEWPPLLDEDLTRIAIAAKQIFADI